MSNPMYNEFASEYDKAIRDNIYNAHFERPSLLAMLPELTGKRVLDLGCGPGVYAENLVAEGAIVTAVDISSQMVRITRAKLGDKVNCYVQDLAAGIPKEKNSHFDLVISPLSIHYIEDLSILFKDIRRVMRPGALFIFSTHHPAVDFASSKSGNYFSLEKIVESWHTLGQPVEVSYYRRPLSDISNALSAAGMCILQIAEGQPTEAMQALSPKHYKKLTTKPNFLFYKCCLAPALET